MSTEWHLREQLCEIMKRLYIRGLISSVGGNSSVICREEGYVLITPTGLDKLNIAPGDIVKIDLEGRVLGEGKPSTESINHLSLYKTRTDIGAVIHAHPPTAVGMVSAGFLPQGVTPEYVVMVGNLAVVEFATPGGDAVKKLNEGLSRSNIVLLKNHGVFSVGNTLPEAFARVEVLEEAAKMVMAGRLFGGMPELTEAQRRDVLEKYGRKR
ncbi:MAG: class II aldolase/adducin family protein [Firmicutes bacterium]|nr:class II aldolase/adducin family protein [Candidatus Fermentithermobacillaceae bacterium]